MDRERKDELPQMQVGFIDVICLPLYKVLSDTFPWIRPLYDGCLENRNHWQDLAEKVEMGLTWIDHDTIDKPVEEFTGRRRKPENLHPKSDDPPPLPPAQFCQSVRPRSHPIIQTEGGNLKHSLPMDGNTHRENGKLQPATLKYFLQSSL